MMDGLGDLLGLHSMFQKQKLDQQIMAMEQQMKYGVFGSSSTLYGSYPPKKFPQTKKCSWCGGFQPRYCHSEKW